MYEVCRGACDLLTDVGTPKANLGLCKGQATWPCYEFPANLRLLGDTVNSESADAIIEFVEDLFEGHLEELYDAPRSINNEPPFRCPEIDVDIYQPCNVSSCSFHTDQVPWSRNCILHYLARHDCYVERAGPVLTNHDLSILVGASPTSVRSAISKATARMRQGALKEEIQKEPDAAMVTRLGVDNVCAVCEKPFTKPYVVKEGIQYCSAACREAKPPVEIRIEKEFALPIVRILELCTQRFATVPVMANAVAVSQTVFRNLCTKYKIEYPD